jgi:hypothetical protein
MPTTRYRQSRYRQNLPNAIQVVCDGEAIDYSPEAMSDLLDAVLLKGVYDLSPDELRRIEAVVVQWMPQYEDRRNGERGHDPG